MKNILAIKISEAVRSEIPIILSFHRVLKTFAGGYKLGQKSEAMNDTGVEEKSDLKLR